MATRIGLLCVLTLLAAACSNDQTPSEMETGPPTDRSATPATPPSTALPPAANMPPAPAVEDRPAPVAPKPPPSPVREVTDEELQPLRDAVARDLDDVTAQRNLARLLWEGGQHAMALNHFERAVQIDPNDPRSLRDLGRAYAMLGRPTDAEGAFRHMATIPATFHVALYEMGKLALDQGDLETATRYFAQSVESKPDYMGSLYNLGVAYEQAGRFREAYESYARVLQLEPPEGGAAALDYVDALYRMGKLDLKMGAVERAVEILTEVVGAYPDHPEAHYEFGRALQSLGRQEEAEREFAIHQQLLAATTTP